jgi:TonB family protein
MIGPDGSWSEEILSEGAGGSSAYPLLMAVYQELVDGVPAGSSLLPAQLSAFSKRSLIHAAGSEFSRAVRRRALPPLIAIGIGAVLLSSFIWVGRFLTTQVPEPSPAASPGTVNLEINIDADGSAHVSKVLSGDPGLTSGAVETINRWTYKPAEINGKPVSATTRMEIKVDSPQSR